MQLNYGKFRRVLYVISCYTLPLTFLNYLQITDIVDGALSYCYLENHGWSHHQIDYF